MLDDHLIGIILRKVEEVLRTHRPEVEHAVQAALRTCPRCGTVFAKHRKQVYCTPACAQQTRWARYAAKRPARDYQRERDAARAKAVEDGAVERVQAQVLHDMRQRGREKFVAEYQHTQHKGETP